MAKSVNSWFLNLKTFNKHGNGILSISKKFIVSNHNFSYYLNINQLLKLFCRRCGNKGERLQSMNSEYQGG